MNYDCVLSVHASVMLHPCHHHLHAQPIRPKEIWGWLEAYQNDKGKVVSEWVAIDDRELLMEQGGEKLTRNYDTQHTIDAP